MKKVRIFIEDITHSWGTERAVVNLVNNLQSHGYQVSISSLYSNCGSPGFPINPGIEIEHLNVARDSKRSPISKIFRIMNMTHSIRGAIRPDDAVILGTEVNINSVLAHIKRGKGFKSRKFIACEHMPYSFPSRFAKLIRGLSYKYLDNIVVLTQADRNKYLSKGFSGLTIIPNEAPDVTTKESLNREKVLLAVGRLVEQKGFDIMIQDVAPLLKEFHDWKLEIYGEGELKTELLGLIDACQMDGKIFICSPTQRIFDKYQTSSVYLMTSRYEGFGMVLVEAQANGLPVVAYDCQVGPSEIIHDSQDGYLVPIGHSEAFRSRVRELILDEDKRVDMGRRGRQAAQVFSREAVFQKWKELLD